MLLKVQDRDLHPFGRGGVYEGVLKGTTDDSELNTSKAIAWIILCGCISFMSFGIVVLAGGCFPLFKLAVNVFLCLN